jgi:hypothetical protein
MRSVVFTTGTPDTIKLVRSWTSLGHETEVIQYDVEPKNGPHHLNIVGEAQRVRPDVMIYIGAIKEIHHSWVPATAELVEANRIAPMVHICSDSADPPWWASLEEYHRERAFELQVGIDGAYETPIPSFGDRGMVGLTPVDPIPFANAIPFASRPVACGFAGGIGIREDILHPIRGAGLLTHFGNGGHGAEYHDLCRFYTTCRTVINDARTGSTAKRHVKGRFVEAALGGAVILEPSDSPAKQWFVPGEDFYEISGPPEAIGRINDITRNPAAHEHIGKSIRGKMLRDHAGPVFWARVLDRIGK